MAHRSTLVTAREACGDLRPAIESKHLSLQPMYNPKDDASMGVRAHRPHLHPIWNPNLGFPPRRTGTQIAPQHLQRDNDAHGRRRRQLRLRPNQAFTGNLAPITGWSTRSSSTVIQHTPWGRPCRRKPPTTGAAAVSRPRTAAPPG